MSTYHNDLTELPQYELDERRYSADATVRHDARRESRRRLAALLAEAPNRASVSLQS
jgi:hypothetical protein